MNEHPDKGSVRRQEAIVDLVRSGTVRSQAQFQQLLRKRGIVVAQPTLSRDLRELGLAKTPAAISSRPPRTGSSRRPSCGRKSSGAPSAASPSPWCPRAPGGDQDAAGRRPPVARALDEAALAGVAGTIAGDDTVFVATPGERAARALARRLTASSSGGREEPGDERRRARGTSSSPRIARDSIST